MGEKKGSNKGRRGEGEGEGWDKREEAVGGIMCVCVDVCI